MEASEAVRRIFWRHRWLLVILVLVPAAITGPYFLMQPVTYAATANVQAQAAAPDADTQVVAILSKVTALATSPQIVQAAITSAGVRRNALDVAKHEISATSLSSSAVVALTVTDPSRPVAIKLTRALAAAVVGALDTLGQQPTAQLAALAKQLTQLNASRTTLVSKLAKAQARNEPATSAGVQALITQLTAVEAQISANQSAAQQILAASSASQSAAIISDPSTAVSVSRHVAVYTALAGLLGVVIALLIAMARELARPTVADPGAGARDLSLVLLGGARLRKNERPDIDPDLPARLDLAAHRLEARTLVLTGPVPPAQLSVLAAHLNGAVPAIEDPADQADGNGAGSASNRISGIASLASFPSLTLDARADKTVSVADRQHGADSALMVTALPDITLRARPTGPALVLVLPRFAPRAALDQAVDLGVTTGWPILGVIGLGSRRRRRRPRPVTSAVPKRPATVRSPAIAPADDGSSKTRSSADQMDSAL